jgi:hypothetical protein
MGTGLESMRPVPASPQDQRQQHNSDLDHDGGVDLDLSCLYTTETTIPPR